MSLQGKKILLGVCGGIAAYKCAYLTRLLIKEGAEVRVMMTPGARDFVGAVTFSTLSKNPVAIEYFNAANGVWNNHVAWGSWGDVCLIAPATANTIAKMAQGISDNFLLATYLSCRCKVLIAPAMDLDMWQHAATQRNIALLKEAGNELIAPGTGELASGLTGEGRMAEPEEILAALRVFFSPVNKRLTGKKVLITAGPTYEAIDPVRFIGNHSSGKMGFALAEVFAAEGADVTVVHGPVTHPPVAARFKTIAVESADQMLAACEDEFSSTDIFVAAAAVADFAPITTAIQKIKKGSDEKETMQISLRRTPDILKTLAAKRSKVQWVIGFALETENPVENARKKLATKGADMIVLNTLQDAGAGFQHDTNKITILDKTNNVVNFELKSKQAAAADIVNHLIHLMHA